MAVLNPDGEEVAVAKGLVQLDPWAYQKMSWIMEQRARLAKNNAKKLPTIGRRPSQKTILPT